MANSQQRRPKNKSTKQRRLRRRRDAHRTRSEWHRVATLDPDHLGRDVAALLTDDDRYQMELCAEAEAEGDVERALHHYLAGPHIEGVPQLHDLLTLRDLGDAVPRWAWSRWILRQASRWMLLSEDPRVEDAVLTTICATYDDLDALELYDKDKLFELGTRIATTSWVAHQVLLYEYGGLSDYLDVKVGPALLGRADAPFAWSAASMGGYRFVDLDRDRLVVVDLADDQTIEVLNIGASTGLSRNDTVIGRLVPVGVSPGLMFESRPLLVDEQTAVEVTQSRDGEWLSAIFAGVAAGRLREAVGIGNHPPLMSDVLPDPRSAVRCDVESELSGRGRDLLDAGLSIEVAQAVCTCEVALTVADVAASGLPACAPHAALALSHRAVFDAAMRHCTAPDQESSWRQVAACVAEPARSRCLALADACRRSAA